MKWFGREPAQWIALFAGIALLAAPLLPITDLQHGVVNAAIAALSGFATALAVSGEKAAPLVAGLVKAVLAVALAWHLQFSADAQATVMVFVEAAVAFYLRTQIIAPVPPALAHGAHEAP